jgi:hypothetical protein
MPPTARPGSNRAPSASKTGNVIPDMVIPPEIPEDRQRFAN